MNFMWSYHETSQPRRWNAWHFQPLGSSSGFSPLASALCAAAPAFSHGGMLRLWHLDCNGGLRRTGGDHRGCQGGFYRWVQYSGDIMGYTHNHIMRICMLCSVIYIICIYCLMLCYVVLCYVVLCYAMLIFMFMCMLCLCLCVCYVMSWYVFVMGILGSRLSGGMGSNQPDRVKHHVSPCFIAMFRRIDHHEMGISRQKTCQKLGRGHHRMWISYDFLGCLPFFSRFVDWSPFLLKPRWVWSPLKRLRRAQSDQSGFLSWQGPQVLPYGQSRHHGYIVIIHI